MADELLFDLMQNASFVVSFFFISELFFSYHGPLLNFTYHRKWVFNSMNNT